MKKLLPTALAALLAISLPVIAEEIQPDGYRDTPLLPGGKWHVHDPDRPQPPVVTPGAVTKESVSTAKPPSDAIVLFDGTDLSKWRNAGGGESQWQVQDGAMVVAGKGDIFTRQEFGDIQLHLEWAEPVPAKGIHQGRGNSGVFFMGKYEIQVLDCYENKTYPDGQTAALYGMHPPLANACRPPGEWQTYDIIFTAPIFASDGTVKQPAFATVIHNGVVVQNHAAFLGASGHKIVSKYTPHAPVAPLKLQEHGNPVRFRNIWVRPLPQGES